MSRTTLLMAAAGYRAGSGGGISNPPYGTYRADGTNTGPNGTYSLFKMSTASLDTTDANHAVVYNTPGQVVIGKKIGYAIILTPASNPVKFYSCWFAGIVGASGHPGLFDTSGESVGGTTGKVCGGQAFDCLMSVQVGAAQTYLNGVYGHDWWLERCEVTGGTDLLRTHNAYSSGASNCWHYGCYLHGYTGWLVDPSQGNTPSHNDVWQQEGGGNCGGVGSTMLGFVNTTLGDGGSAGWQSTRFSNPSFGGGLQGNSVMQMNNNTGAVPSFTLTSCYIDGGYISLNMANNGSFSATNHLSLVSNRFGRNQGAQVSGGDGTATLYAKTGTVYDAYSGNVYDDNSHAITARLN